MSGAVGGEGGAGSVGVSDLLNEALVTASGVVPVPAVCAATGVWAEME